MNIGICSNRPDRIAIIDLSDGDRTFTYKDLNDKSNAVCNELLHRGISKGDSIGLISSNCAELVIYFYGIMKAGAVCLLIDPKSKHKSHLITNSDIKMLIDQEQGFLGDLNDFTDNTIEVNDSDIAFCMYTSGSTGTPKGVLHSHKNRNWIIEKRSVKSSVQRTSLITTPLQYASALSNLQNNIRSENAIVLMSKFNATACLTAIEKYKITDITVPVSIANLLLDCKPLIERVNLGSVKFISVGSSVVRESTINKLKQYFRNASLKIYYGITEVGPNLFGNHPSLPTPDMSVGYPIDGIDYRIVDGILHIKTPSMFRGYTNHNITLVDDYYNTNDYFSVDDNGFYYCNGRADDSFKSGGYTIIPSEIEQIVEQFPKVKTAVIVPADDNIKVFKPVCFIQCSAKIDIDNLNKYLYDKLEPYKVPKKFYFITNIPFTPNGKVDRKQLMTMIGDYEK